MRAHEIRDGDELPGTYKVEHVSAVQGCVIAKVRFVDGGVAYREWHPDANVPLVRQV